MMNELMHHFIISVQSGLSGFVPMPVEAHSWHFCFLTLNQCKIDTFIHFLFICFGFTLHVIKRIKKHNLG